MAGLLQINYVNFAGEPGVLTVHLPKTSQAGKGARIPSGLRNTNCLGGGVLFWLLLPLNFVAVGDGLLGHSFPALSAGHEPNLGSV